MPRYLNTNSDQAQTAAQTQPVQTTQTPPTDTQLLRQHENEIRGIDSQISSLNQRRGELEALCADLRSKLDAAREKEVKKLIEEAANKTGKTKDQIRALIQPFVDMGIDVIPTLRGMIGT